MYVYSRFNFETKLLYAFFKIEGLLYRFVLIMHIRMYGNVSYRTDFTGKWRIMEKFIRFHVYYDENDEMNVFTYTYISVDISFIIY